MKKWKNIKIQEQLMKDIEKVKNEKHFKSKSKFLEDAVNEKLERIKDEDLKDRLADIQEFLEKNSVTLRRKGINNMSDLASQTLSNSEDIKKSQSEISAMKKDLVRLKLQNNMAEHVAKRAIMGKVGLTIAEAAELKKIVQEGRFDETLKQMKKDVETTLEKNVNEILSDPDKVKKLLKK